MRAFPLQFAWLPKLSAKAKTRLEQRVKSRLVPGRTVACRAKPKLPLPTLGSSEAAGQLDEMGCSNSVPDKHKKSPAAREARAAHQHRAVGAIQDLDGPARDTDQPLQQALGGGSALVVLGKETPCDPAHFCAP